MNLYIENQIRSAIADKTREVGAAQARSSQRPSRPATFRALAARTLVRAGTELDRHAAVTALRDAEAA